ncbi:hypothetical protein [Pontiella agarivorans]|uniref:Uncharacterized protein n=1 Tax=Pontiella agarivorans TaxID=3038953 RepID=A0ABU5MTK4_9BACT|nr:hypothetical protein [Pontiella agarivorans]MDZ8117533.1 hypothetical protein [Pontiella agarivorans]
MKLYGLIAVVTGFLSQACMCSPGGEPAKVTVHLLDEQVLGETSELDRSTFFNVHSSYTGAALTADDLEQLKSLNVGFGRAFDGPFSGHQNGTPYPDTAVIRTRAPGVIARAKADPLYAYRTTRRIITDEPGTVFNMQDDPAEMARYAADILEYNYEDDFRPDFYSPISLPFVAAGKYGEDQAAVRERMTQVIARIGEEIDRRGLSTQVIGYTSAWPMMHFWDFGHWHGRMKMFMDVAGEHIDAIDFILMDATQYEKDDSRRSGSRVEALMDLVETYGAMKWGKPKPFAFSEYGDVSSGWPEGDTYSPARSSAELNAYNHFLFSLLGREDRLLIAVPFITTKSPWFYKNPKNRWQPFSADLWRPDPESIVDNNPTRFLETEKMEFYRLWCDVKGRRVFTESTDPDVAVYAFVDGPDVYICLNSFKEEQHPVSLVLPGQNAEPERVEIKRMFIPRQQAVQYTVERTGILPKELVLEPHETRIVRITYSTPVVSGRTVKTRTYYSDTCLQPIVADQPVEFCINGVVADAPTAASLRVSFAREHDRSKKPLLTVNGQSIEFPDNWMGDDQANRKGGFFGAIPVSVPDGILQTDNRISLIFSDDGGRVSTVVLDVHSGN